MCWVRYQLGTLKALPVASCGILRGRSGGGPADKHGVQLEGGIGSGCGQGLWVFCFELIAILQ